MSYILDALKKAQRERQRENSLDIHDLTSAAWDPNDHRAGSKRLWLPPVFGTLLGLVSIILMYFVIAEKMNTSGEIESVETVEIQHTIKTDQLDAGNHELETAPETIAKIKGNKRYGAPEVSITGSIYIADGSEGNRIFIGNQIFREGDIINQVWIIYRIGSEVIELRSGENSILINY